MTWNLAQKDSLQKNLCYRNAFFKKSLFFSRQGRRSGCFLLFLFNFYLYEFEFAFHCHYSLYAIQLSLHYGIVF